MLVDGLGPARDSIVVFIVVLCHVWLLDALRVLYGLTFLSLLRLSRDLARLQRVKLPTGFLSLPLLVREILEADDPIALVNRIELLFESLLKC